MVAIPDPCGGSCLSWSWGADISLTLHKCLSGIMDDKHWKMRLALSIFAVSLSVQIHWNFQVLNACFHVSLVPLQNICKHTIPHIFSPSLKYQFNTVSCSLSVYLLDLSIDQSGHLAMYCSCLTIYQPICRLLCIFIHEFLCQSFRSHAPSLAHSFIHSFIQSFTHSLTHSFTDSFGPPEFILQSFIPSSLTGRFSLVRSFVHSTFHSVNGSSTYIRSSSFVSLNACHYHIVQIWHMT